MAKRKDATAGSHNGTSASSAKSTASSSYAPPRAQPRTTAAAAPNPPKPSPFRVVTLLFRIASLCFAIYVLYKKMYPSPSSSSQNQLANELDQFSRRTRSGVDSEPITADHEKLEAIVEAFKHSYKAYERDAFGFDDYHPISHRGSNMSPAGPVGYFLIDSLDSLLLVGLEDEYQRARDWVANELDFDLDDKYHTFEITIRVLGGLLSAYHFSGETDQVLLDKAVDLADRLLPVFDTPSGLPLSFVNLAKRQAIPDMDNNGLTSVAEAGTLQLEFKYLSHLTGNSVYRDKVEKVMEVIRAQPTKDGLVPIFMDPIRGIFIMSDVRLGSRGDSFYEYMSKQYFQTSKTEPVYREMHDGAMRGIARHLVKKSVTRDLIYTSELIPRRVPGGELQLVDTPKQDHLVCFLGATLLLGVTDGNSLPVPPDESTFTDAQRDEWFLGQELTRTCVDTYFSTKTGLAPEIVNFFTHRNDANRYKREWFINSRQTGPNVDPPIDARNILRPETVESLFVAYRVTGDPIYREWGWRIFQAFEKHCRLPEGGYASVRDVDELPVIHEDRMETFWISETLKYFFLLFSDADVVPLDRYTLNTEAHPLPNFTPRW
ncbi:putative Mannosyl-oligosaccharide 1,2-alpha-mannosidase [Rhodotorula taiwanensis]|uniref:alpha-1,2-Mannosidase n=1 Tax=Rhodotorula taiwanensis TaxID=741276 RepID=A0A2S5BGD0_9BASI|nr:putative Mannosyl-oligosaccharide 1,2-alpha-mannosidase [Rhodotorula taiwanensis]